MKKRKRKKKFINRKPPPNPPRVADSSHRPQPHTPDSSFTQDHIDEFWDKIRRDDNHFLYGLILVLIGIVILACFTIKTQ